MEKRDAEITRERERGRKMRQGGSRERGKLRASVHPVFTLFTEILVSLRLSLAHYVDGGMRW